MARRNPRTRRNKVAALALVLLVALSAPLAALLVPGGPLHDLVSSPPVDAPLPGLDDLPELPANDLALARRLVLEAAAMRGIVVTPLPVPLASLTDPLPHALAEWLFVVHGEAGEAWLPDALAQAERVPDEARASIATLLQAHAQATILQREALGALSPDEMMRFDAIARNPAALASFLAEPPAWAFDAATRVDLGRSVQAAVLLIDAAAATFPALADLPLAAPVADAAGFETSTFETGPLSQYLPALTAAHETSGLALLDKLLSTLLSTRVPAAPAVSLTEQVSAIAKGLGSGDTSDLGAPARLPGPPGTSTLPKNLDLELGRLLTGALGSVEVLATHGPEALATSHLARVRSMEAALPTLEAWASVFETAHLDARNLVDPQLAGGAALARAAELPRTQSVAAYAAFGLGTPPPAAFPASAPDDAVPALAALYDAVGRAPPPGWRADAASVFDQLTPAQRAAIATLARAVAQATALAERATSRLTAADAERFHDATPTLTRFLSGEQLNADELDTVDALLGLAGLVDMDLVADALLVQAAAADTALALLGTGTSVPTSQHEDANCPSDVPFVTDCANGIYFHDFFDLVVIGGPGPSRIDLEDDAFAVTGVPVLFIELGGDDVVDGAVASANFLRPAALAIDLGGTDAYTSTDVTQGAGVLGGAALMVQAGGDTHSTAGGGSQGFSIVGMGAYVDLGGNDRYRGNGGNLGISQPAFTGLGLLVDVAGTDEYVTPQGAGRSLGGVFLDLGGDDTYRVEDAPLGVPLDQPLDSDYVLDALFASRKDNALWLDGEHALDPGFGLDLDLATLDHDADLFPSLVETLAGSDANDPDSTPVTALDTTLAGLGDEDEDGGANLVEEALGTSAGNETEGPVGLPSDLPLVPSEIADVYRELRARYTEAPPPNGLILDVRVPFTGRWNLERTCAGGFFGPPDAPIVAVSALCIDTTGPDDDELHDSDLTFVETNVAPNVPDPSDPDLDALFGSLFEGDSEAGNFGTGKLQSTATLGLVAVGDVVNSTFELPYLLSVDLGGDDTYLEGAGGAIVVETTARSKLVGSGNSFALRDPETTVSAYLPMTHLDLGGNDTYLGEGVAQGAGGGLLVDLNGRDTYEGGRANQGALGGILLDDQGNDTYRAGDLSQGASLPVVGFARVPLASGGSVPVAPFTAALLTTYGAASARTEQPTLLIDTTGDDSYEALDSSQGFAVMPRLTGQEVSQDTDEQSDPPYVNGTMLVATLLDLDGNDTYVAGSYAQGVAGPGGVGVLVDRFGTDSYQAGSRVSQGAPDARTLGRPEHKGPGLAVLLDGRGTDRYVALPEDGGVFDRSNERQDKITRSSIPVDAMRVTGTSSLALLEALHIDIEGSERDTDADGWPDAAETAAGTDGSDGGAAPAPGATNDLGKLIDLPQAGLAIGGLSETTYTNDYALIIDLGGPNRYENNAGGPIIEPLARLPTVVGPPNTAVVAPLIPPTRHTIFAQPVTAVFDLSLLGSTFHTTGDLSQAAALFTVGLVVTATGSHTYEAPQTERALSFVPRTGRARLDGVLAPSEWPVLQEIEWGAELQEGHRAKGQFGLMHDGEFLYVAARIRDESADLLASDDDAFEVYLADNHSEANLFDKLTVSPRRGGTAEDFHAFGQGRGDGCRADWCEDTLIDPNTTSVRMAYSANGWTMELARPLELPGRPKDLRAVQPAWNENDKPEDVPLTEGNLTGLLLRFIDATDNEVWSFPPTGAALDGTLGFEDDNTLRSEARSWLPLFMESLVADPPHLRDGPRAVQGASIGGVSVLVSLGASGGHDRYQGFERAQGFGFLAGIGLLIDLAGSDTYEAREWAQGAARARGVGHLVDYDGNDIYRAFDHAQGVSPDSLPTDGLDQLTAAGAQLARVQAYGMLVDLGGYDHYEYEPIDSKHAFIALRAKSTDAPYVTYPDNDWVWTQGGANEKGVIGQGGVGLDTFLATRHQHVLGADNVNTPPDPSMSMRIGDAHLGACRFQVPYTDDREPFHVEHGALVVNGTACVEAEVAVVPGRGFVPGRAELLRSGERFDRRSSPGSVVSGLRDGEPVDIYRYRFDVPTRALDDGFEDWRVVSYMAVDADDVGPVTRPGTFIVQDNRTVLLSNPPFPLRLDARARAFSTHAAIGHDGLPIDVKVSHDVSEDRLLLAGYRADRTNIPCPFDVERLCNRYPLYLKRNEHLDPEPATEALPTSQGNEEVGWGRTNDADPVAGLKFSHTFAADLTLTGAGGIGFVAVGDADVDRSYLPDEAAEAPEVPQFEGFVALAWADPDDADALPVGGLVLLQQQAGDEVARGDLRLTPMGGRPPGTFVQPVDGDRALVANPLPDAQVAFLDADGDGRLGPPDTIYVDVAGDGAATPAVGDAAGDVRITGFANLPAGSFILPGDADAGALVVALPAELGIDAWRAVDVDDHAAPASYSDNDLAYIDVDRSGFVSEGDVRLGVASHDDPLDHADGTAARLVYYHQPYFVGDVQVHAKLVTGTIEPNEGGDAPPIFTPGVLLAGQPSPVIAESVGGVKAVSPITPSLEPGGGDVADWSTFWLPFDETRTYRGGDPADLGQEDSNGLQLRVRTAAVDGDGPIADTCVATPIIIVRVCGDDQTPSIVDCSVPDTPDTAVLGLCLSTQFMDMDLTPSRLELYVPTETEMFVRVNATALAGLGESIATAVREAEASFTDATKEDQREERVAAARSRAIRVATDRVVEVTLEGDVLREVRWTKRMPDGYYALNLTAFDVGPHIENGRVVVGERWGRSLPGETVLLDATAPEARIIASPFTGTTQIDPLTEAMTLRWTATDGSPTNSSGIDELRIYAAPGDSPPLSEWKLVQIVKNVDRDGVDFVLDARHETYSFAVVAKDEVGNIDGVRENFWPSHRCPEGNRRLVPWPPAEGRAGVPDLETNCFAKKADAIRGAFARGLRAQISQGDVTVTTIDRSLPAFTRVRFTLADGLELPVLRVGTRDVKALAAGSEARVEGCVAKTGPSGIAGVNFFLLTTLPDGTVVQRKSPLGRPGSDCRDEHGERVPGILFDFTGLGPATADREAYPEGFWTAGIEVLDGAGNSAQESFGVVYLDGSPPRIDEGGVQFPRGQTAVAFGQALTVDLVASDATQVVRGTLAAPRLNSTGPVELRVTRTGAVTGRLGIDQVVPDGAYLAYLNLTDALGNTLVQQIEVTVDTTATGFVSPPVVASQDPARLGEGVAVSTLSDGFVLAFATTTPARWQVLAGTNPARLSTVAEGLGPFNVTHQAIVEGLAPSTNYFVRVEAWAPGGLRAATETFQVRTGASFLVHVLSPAAGQALSARPVVRWSAAPVLAEDVAERELSFLVSVRRAPATPWEVVGGATGPLGDGFLTLDLSAFPNGRTYGLRVEALEGRERTSSVVEPLTLDKEGPVAVLLDPATGWTNDTRPDITLELRDVLSGLPGDPVAHASVDGREATYTVREAGRVITIAAPGELSPGAHTLSVSIGDGAGNVAETLIPLNVDVTPPRLTVVSLDDVIAVRPGAPLAIELFGEDDGELALAQATLGASIAQVFDPGARTVLRLPAPDSSALDLPLVIRLIDKAGNVASVVKRVVLDGVPPTIVDAQASPEMTTARVMVQATEPVRVSTVLDGAPYLSTLSREAQVTLAGLRPGRSYLVDLSVEDLAGNAVRQAITFTTKPDLVPPTAVSGLTAQALPDGTISLGWGAAQDNAGIDRYEVLRRLAAGDTFARVAETASTQFVDRDAAPGASYLYRVQAIDVGSRLGPAEQVGPVSPVGVARLHAALLSPTIGRAGDRFTFRVEVTQPGGPEPQEVALVLDGVRMPMKKAEGSIGEGLAYQLTLPVEPHGPAGPHTYHFEALTAGALSRVVRLPAQGDLEGPLVTVLDDPRDATSGVVALARDPVIALPAFAIMLAAGAFLFMRRRWRP